ncbi:MAG TPA: hypothetical protein VHF86_09580 [Xanthomonadaceae bacterium]|nr:hypothetical protein [Xanthomonadaceae bacterium]
MTVQDSEKRAQSEHAQWEHAQSERALWELERQFWTGDASFHAANLAPEAWMLLPAPAGLMSHTESLQALAQAPRWSEVAFSETKMLAPGDGVALLVYAVEALRGGHSDNMHLDNPRSDNPRSDEEQAPYRAWCSSAYLRTPSGWRLLLHQQTPR